MTTLKTTYSLYDDPSHKTVTEHESQAVRLHPRYTEANDTAPLEERVEDSATTINAVHESPKEGVTTPIEPIATPESPKTPGSFLRHAREQQKLSMEHVADKLCLHHALVRDLEADRYDNMPAPVFIRGYIRAYSNLLDLPAEEVLALHQPMTGEPATPQLSAGSNRSKTQTSSGDPWFKVGTFVLFLVLMILMTLWKLYPNNTEDSLPEPAHLLPPTPELPMNNSTQLPTSNATPLPTQPIPMSSQPLSQQASGLGGTETSNNAGSDIVYTPPAEDENAEITTTVISAEAPAATEEVETTATGNNAATVNRFSLVVSADAWMQINDKEGKPIFLGTAKPSQTIELKGTPPFQVRVGNIDGVNVKHNGSAKPLSDFPREGRRVYIVGQPAE